MIGYITSCLSFDWLENLVSPDVAFAFACLFLLAFTAWILNFVSHLIFKVFKG